MDTAGLDRVCELSDEQHASGIKQREHDGLGGQEARQQPDVVDKPFDPTKRIDSPARDALTSGAFRLICRMRLIHGILPEKLPLERLTMA